MIQYLVPGSDPSCPFIITGDTNRLNITIIYAELFSKYRLIASLVGRSHGIQNEMKGVDIEIQGNSKADTSMYYFSPWQCKWTLWDYCNWTWRRNEGFVAVVIDSSSVPGLDAPFSTTSHYCQPFDGINTYCQLAYYEKHLNFVI